MLQAGAMASTRASRWDFMDDLSVPPPQFVESLKVAYGSDRGKAGSKFHSLSRSLTQALKAAPEPGPCTFVARCVEILVEMGPSSDQGLGHLVTRSLSELGESFKSPEDVSTSKSIAANMFKDAVHEVRAIDKRLLVRLILVLDIQILDLAEAYDPGEDETKAKTKVEEFILNLVKKRAYNAAVSLLRHFNLQDCAAQDFMISMVRDGQAELAGQWAEYLGREKCSFLVQQCIEMEYYKPAYRLVKRYRLQDEFPDAFYLYRRSSLRKLVGKGLWDIAESIAGEDLVLQKYLVTLALGRRQHKRALVLSETFQLKDFDLSAIDISDVEEGFCDFIQLEQILEHEKVFWIDSKENLAGLASQAILEANVVGIDCEWKANRVKGEEPNKVAILQLATKQLVLVLDLLKLATDNETKDVLNNFMKRIFDSVNILKLGYGIHNDFNHLARSYPQVDAFHSCRSFIDLECFPDNKRVPGGISGLAKWAMGSEVDKSIRMSDWSRRPLTTDQLHYAALDAAILVPLHEIVCSKHSVPDMGRSLAKTWHYSSNSSRCDEVQEPELEIDESDSDECRTMLEGNEHILDELDQPISGQVKCDLQEYTVAAGLPLPTYEMTSCGPGHLRLYRCTVAVADKTFQGTPTSKKKEAEHSAAQVALNYFKPQA